MDQKAVKDVIEYLLLVHKNMCYTVAFVFAEQRVSEENTSGSGTNVPSGNNDVVVILCFLPPAIVVQAHSTTASRIFAGLWLKC